MGLFSTIKPTKVKAFPGKPRAVYTTDHSGTRQGIRVSGQYRTPLGDRTADVLAFFGMIVLVVMNLEAISKQSEPAFERLLFAALAYFPLKLWLRTILRQEVSIDLLTNEVTVKRFFLPRSFPRAEVQGFAVMEPHEKAAHEKAKHEFEVRRDQLKRRARFRTRYYQDAAQLFLIVGGERFEVLSASRAKDAHALAERSNRSMREIDQYMERRVSALREQAAVAVPGQLPD
ncbi:MULTISPECIES: hypothetical protein [unclassified Mameliella]|uniref:hypothetical protein n=1 Tax=unclassified Mameliella TaxID=2630630 RepID=UPI00273F52FC|nr:MULTISPECIES: hypothetical protein [unclassified Mameliella]